METADKAITVETIINAPVEKVWRHWTEPAHITRWCNASDDWHAPHAENDLRVEGTFKTTMAAKDNSVSFDFEGRYTEVREHEVIAYVLADGRKVRVLFTSDGDKTNVRETFDPEGMNPPEMQKAGWQAILDNFGKHTAESED